MVAPAALDAALRLAERPATIRHVRNAPLPDGVVLLLRVAAEQTDALCAAQAMTGCPQAALQQAVRFFIEQVMFHGEANSYRVLGASAGSPRTELRRNMALLITWLHPDGEERRMSKAGLDRRHFLRVTEAWEDLKTDQRQASYDRLLDERRKMQSRGTSARSGAEADPQSRDSGRGRASPSRPGQKRARQRLIVCRIERGTVWSRLLHRLWMRL